MSRLEKKCTFIVTGGLGFIGSHFVDEVLSKGHKVINYDKETYAAHTDLNSLVIMSKLRLTYLTLSHCLIAIL